MGEWGIGKTSMRRLGLLILMAAVGAEARRDEAGCATTQQTAAEVLFLHRQVKRSRARAATATASTNRDIGNVAIIESSGGVVETPNQFNLDGSTLTFAPATSTTYRYALTAGGYDATAAAQGSPVVALGDDDSRLFALPFAFPFFGTVYRALYLNSDGNLTFNAGDNASSGRSVGRMTGGAPRISPLFDDLDPSQPGGGVRYFADASHVVFSWVNVAEYAQTGLGLPQTFQVRLYLDGRIQFSYQGGAPASAVVGIAPGAERGGTALVSFLHDPAVEQGGAVIERFGNSQDIDVISAAQKFYETHEDAYDYLVIYNNLNIWAAPGAVAYESTVRSSGMGYGVPVADHGVEYGSGSRLRSVLNMGTLSNYDKDANALVQARASSQDTPLTVLGHEAGHLFLAFSSVADASNPGAQPMIGFGGAHWSFVFNSEASLDEGEQITDRGAGASPRFVTSAVTQGYSPLDRYLMGLGPASDVPPTFYVKDSGISPIGHPALGKSFNGTPVAVTVDDVAQAMGRRTPDYTVAQHHFRFGFILVVAAGSPDSTLTDSVQKVEGYRQQFPAAYTKFSGNLGAAETTFNKRVRLSLFPAAGVVAGGSTTATLTLDSAPARDMAVQMATANGYAQATAQVMVAAGTKSATFAVTGLKAGVEELTATPADTGYETAFARVQVAAASQLSLRTVSGDNQVPTSEGALAAPVVVSLTDVNGLVYGGARIAASAASGGSVTPAVGTTDGTGQASFQWTPGTGASNSLTLAVEAAPAVTLQLNAGSATPAIGAVVNAASNLPGMAAGSIDTIYGVNLRDAAVALNGVAVKVFYQSDTQLNFYVPAGAALGAGTLTATNAAGVTATARVTVTATDPGIFPGAVIQAGGYLEIYCTGLGPTRASGGLNVTTVTPVVYLGSTPLTPVFSGLAPGFMGLYQVNVLVPAGLTPGSLPVVIASGQTYSNEVRISVFPQ